MESLEERMQLSAVSPVSVSLGAGSALDLTKTEAVPLSITLPSAEVTNKVDIALLLDDTGSFKSFAGTVESLFSDLVTSLQAALPEVDLGFGVARFEDYGGPFSPISSERPSGRPFFLDQPIVTAATATAAGTDLNTLMSKALAATGPGFGGDTPEADIEALYQLATGAGLDGNGNGSKLDSGPAGDLATTEVSPGTSGDVPPFSSNVGLTSGSLGGIGWRPDAQHIVLLATDTQPVAAFSGSTIPAAIAGLGGLSVPSTAFESTAGRVGFVSTAVDGTGTGPQPGVEPLGGATVQETVTALNKLGIYVIGMGPGAAPTTSTVASLAPSTFFSALGRLTGSVDPKSGDPLVFSTSVSTADLTTAIVNSVKTVATKPINIGLSPEAIPTGLTFTPAPSLVANVGPGGTATFDVTLAVGALPYTGSFDADFVDASTGLVLGKVTFQINLPGVPDRGTPGVPDPGTTASPSDPPTVISGRRIGIHTHPASILVTFSEAMDAASVQNVKNYVLTAPCGEVIKFASATYDPASLTVTLKPKRHVNFHVNYKLEIKGLGPTAVKSASGILLDGMKTGKPGDNYYGRLRQYTLYPVTASSGKTATTSKKSPHPKPASIPMATPSGPLALKGGLLHER
jgi:hypothetical protein